jgi:hypothetical protein
MPTPESKLAITKNRPIRLIFALMFKPIPILIFYGSFIESLEAGSIVPDNASNWSNKNEVLSPLMSKQHEFGVKAEVGQMLVTAPYLRSRWFSSTADRFLAFMPKTVSNATGVWN